jgi:DNA-binding transcriptional MerR regulator
LTEGKSEGAFRTIGELSTDLGVPQHILRYWETRFPQLRPLTRAGNRRYYRPEDVELARRIHHALTNDGFTIKGVQKLLAGGASAAPVARLNEMKAKPASPPPSPAASATINPPISPEVLTSLVNIRDQLAAALLD